VKSEKFATALERYAKFVRERLQYPDYRTKSNARHGGKNRGYNYAWVADFYFRMSLSTASLATASTASTIPRYHRTQGTGAGRYGFRAPAVAAGLQHHGRHSGEERPELPQVRGELRTVNHRPRRVNGEPAHYADAYANDQDWALMYYLMVTAQVP